MNQSDVLFPQLKLKVHLCVNRWTHLGWSPTTDKQTEVVILDQWTYRSSHSLLLFFRWRLHAFTSCWHSKCFRWIKVNCLCRAKGSLKCKWWSFLLLLLLCKSVHDVHMKTILTNCASYVNMQIYSKPTESWFSVSLLVLQAWGVTANLGLGTSTLQFHLDRKKKTSKSHVRRDMKTAVTKLSLHSIYHAETGSLTQWRPQCLTRQKPWIRFISE